MSLVQVLVGIGITSVLVAVISQAQMNQMKEMKALSEKLAVLDFEKMLISSLADGSTCQHVTNNPSPLTFDSTTISAATPAILTPTEPLYAGVKLGIPGPIVAQVGLGISPAPNSIEVSSINLVITEGSGGQFKGYWEVSLNPVGMVRSLKALRIQTVLIGDISVPTATRITSCMGSATTMPVITRRPAAVTAWRWPSASVSCLPDEYLLSGGGSCISLGPPGTGFMFIAASESTPDSNGWIVRCDTPRNQNARAEVYVLCAKK